MFPMADLPGDAQRPNVSVVRMTRRLFGTFPFVLLVLGTGLGVFAQGERSNAAWIAAEGVSVLATVTDKEADRRSGDEADSYYVTFLMPRGESAMQSGRTNVERSYYEEVAIGDEVPVTYVPSRPNVIEVTQGGAASAAWTLTLMSAATLVAFCALLGRAVYRAFGALRAAQSGEFRQAVVTDRRKTGSSGGGKGRSTIEYGRIEWRDAAGGTGRSLSSPLAKLQDYPEGTGITVLDDPKTGRSWWCQDLGQT